MECYNHQVGNFKSKERLLDCVLPGVVLRPRDSLCSAQGYPAGKFGLPGNMGAVWGGVPCALPPRVRRSCRHHSCPRTAILCRGRGRKSGWVTLSLSTVGSPHTHTHTHTPLCHQGARWQKSPIRAAFEVPGKGLSRAACTGESLLTSVLWGTRVHR